MMAVRTNLLASDLPDNLHAIRSAIEAAVPHGRTDEGGTNDRGAWGDVPEAVIGAFDKTRHDLARISYKATGKIIPRAAARAFKHLGTLGTGNHFIEVCLDEADGVWVMLHSGSRGIGNAIGRHYIEKAKEEMRPWHINLPDADLAYLPEGSDVFDDYVDAVHWAQSFALLNRSLMMDATLSAIQSSLGREVSIGDTAVNCHHNYVERENHFGANVFVTRKGAVRARSTDLGIIPGSMGARSFIVRGKGNPESFCSCSHGAGRAMSRGEAKRRFTVADHMAATEGVECRKDADVLDETPAAYKDIEAVMAAQSDLVEIVHTLKQVCCVKG
jgi:tRNA-splicing ligase RtcB